MENKKIKFDDYKKILNKNILVTGDKGFKGCWLVTSLLKLGCQNIFGIGISNKNDILFNKIKKKCNYQHFDVNINDSKSLSEVIKQIKPDIVFHLAAQPLVIESYKNPKKTYKTNVLGTLNVLDVCLKYKVKLILNITTDKIYKNIENTVGYEETDEIDGYDPYSSSKACVEIMSKSFYDSYLKSQSISLINLRAGNVIGSGDMSLNRIFTDIYKSYLSSKPIHFRNIDSIRPYQHVLEAIFAYIYIASYYIDKNESNFNAYNIAPNMEDEINTYKLAKLSFDLFAKKMKYKISDVPFHETKILKLNNNKIKSILKYFPIYSIEKAVELTVNGYKVFDDDIKFWDIMNKQIEDYIYEIKKNSN